MDYQSAGARKESELERLHKATLRRKAQFESFAVGDRVEVTTGTRAKRGQICLTHPRFITVKFDGHSYKTTLSRADYLTGRFRIKKIEEGDTVAQKIEAPGKEELTAKLLSHQGNINKLAKDYGVVWSTARKWLIERDLMEYSRILINNLRREEEGTEMVEDRVQEAAEPVEQQEPCQAEDRGITLAKLLEGLLDRMDTLEQKLDHLQMDNPSVKAVPEFEFKDVAEIAMKMAQIWIEAGR